VRVRPGFRDWRKRAETGRRPRGASARNDVGVEVPLQTPADVRQFVATALRTHSMGASTERLPGTQQRRGPQISVAASLNESAERSSLIPSGW
jgi:hypothetical protein